MSGNEQEFGTNEYGNPTGRETTTERNRRIAHRLEHTGTRVALARIDRERRRLAMEEELILTRPVEPMPTAEDIDGPVIYFRKTFGNRTIPEYGGWQYAAVRIQSSKGLWFLTGSRAPHSGMSWEDLLNFIVKEEHERPTIYVATQWNEVEWNGQGQPQ